MKLGSLKGSFKYNLDMYVKQTIWDTRKVLKTFLKINDLVQNSNFKWRSQIFYLKWENDCQFRAEIVYNLKIRLRQRFWYPIGIISLLNESETLFTKKQI